MARYIDAELLRLNFPQNEYVREMIDKQPTADVQEVRHGHWIELINPNYSPSDGMHEYIYICSKCGRKEYKRETYCHCGAKMQEHYNSLAETEFELNKEELCRLENMYNELINKVKLGEEVVIK